MKESAVAEHLRRIVEGAGGEVRKVIWAGRKHAPDYRVMLRGLNCWVETKSPTGTANGGQQREHERMRALGEKVHVLSTIAEVDAWVNAPD